MKEKTILEFLLGLRDHLNEGEAYLESVLIPAAEESAQSENSEQSESSEESENSEKSEESENSNNSENSETSDNPPRSDNSENSENQAAAPSESSAQLPPEYTDRLRDSLKYLGGYRAGKEPLAEEWQGVFAMLFSMVSDLARGVITPATVETLLKAAGYERTLMMARREGEVAGRNVRIEEHLRAPQKSDGVPSLQGTGSGSATRRTRSIFDLAGQAR